MWKDALTCLGLTLALLLLVMFSGVWREGISTTITFAGDELASDCGENCVVLDEVSVDSSQGNEDELAKQAPQNLEQALVDNFDQAKSKVEISTYDNDQLWWRSADGYRLVVSGAQTVGVEVENTAGSPNLATKNLNTHPATKNSQIKKAISVTGKYLKKLGFKKKKFSSCPLNYVGDPFNNCVNYFEKDDLKCNLIVGFGGLNDFSNQDKYRLELTCSEHYDQFATVATPLIKATHLFNPEWKTADMAAFKVVEDNGYFRIDFGDRQADRHAIFKKEGQELELLDGGKRAVACSTVSEFGIPSVVSGGCFAE